MGVSLCDFVTVLCDFVTVLCDFVTVLCDFVTVLCDFVTVYYRHSFSTQPPCVLQLKHFTWRIPSTLRKTICSSVLQYFLNTVSVTNDTTLYTARVKQCRSIRSSFVHR